MKSALINLFLFCISLNLFAGDPDGSNPRIDSLLNEVRNHPNDTNGVMACIELAGEVLYEDPALAEKYVTDALKIAVAVNWEGGMSECYGWLAYLLEQRGEIDSAIYYNELALGLAIKTNDKRDQGSILNNLAAIYKDKGMIDKALGLYEESISLARSVNNVEGVSASYNNIGLIYQNLGQVEQALKYYTLSLNLDDSLNNSAGVAKTYLNIASVYREQGQYEPAMQHLQLALDINQENKDQYNEGYVRTQMGSLFLEQGQYDEALEQYRLSYDLRAALDDRQGMAYCLKYIGSVYERQDSLAMASSCYRQSLNMFEQVDDQWGITSLQFLIGQIYFAAGQLDSAQIMGQLSLDNAQQLGFPANIRDAAGLLERIYRAEGKWEEALKMNDLYILMRDSVQNDATRKIAMKNQFEYEFDKKAALLEAQNAARVNEQRLQRNAFIGGFILVLLLAVVLYNRYKIKTAANIELGKKNAIISSEKERSDKLLLNILPQYVANELKETGTTAARSHESVTVMFTDFKDFTRVAEQLSPEELVREINFCFSEFDKILAQYRIEKIKTIGDAYMCAGAIPQGYNGHAAEVVRAALHIRDFMLELKRTKELRGESCFQIRIGIATGPVVAGVVGIKKFAYDIWGDTVNVAARMESSGEGGKVNISETTYQLVKDEFDCTFRGEIEAKNKGRIKMYFAENKPAF